MKWRQMILLGALALSPALSPALAHDQWLAIGDGRISNQPRTGYVFACPGPLEGGGADRVGNWVRDGYWNPALKPVVGGAIDWPDARVAFRRDGAWRQIELNNLPTHPSGIYPIRRDDPAFAYDRNPNRIAARQIALSLPADPVPAARPSCVPMGAIGFAVTGAAIFNALDAMNRDAPAHEILDRCNGHPQARGQYHYHAWTDCLPDASGKAGRHSDLVGYALDGFGIYGPIGESGKPLTPTDLDACHGHIHTVMWDGQPRAIYHYHFTVDYPYTIGCFTGTPVVTARGDRPPPPGGPRPRP